MKKINLLVALLIAVGTFAQKHHPKKDFFTAEQKTQLMVKQMSLDLDLTEKQEAKITPIIAKKVNKMEAKMTAFKEARKNGKKRERKTFSKDEKFEMAISHLEEKKALQNQMKSILNNDQYAQWKEMQKKSKHKKRMITHHKIKEHFKKNKKNRSFKNDDRKQKHRRTTPNS